MEDEYQVLEQFCELVKNDASNIFLPQLAVILGAERVDSNYGVSVDAKILLEDDLFLGHLLLRSPESSIELLSKALLEEQTRLLQHEELCVAITLKTGRVPTYKNHVFARIKGLPGANRKANVSAIRSEDANRFIQVSGTVTRSGMVRVLEAERRFVCNNDQCSHVIAVYSSKYESGGIIEKPSGPCPSCKRSSSYTESKKDTICHDYQEIRVQEQVQKLGMGSIPRSIGVILLHDLVDSCKAGDDVVVTGIPFHRWSRITLGERCNLETVIDANTVHVLNTANHGAVLSDEKKQYFQDFWSYWNAQAKKPFLGRNLITASVCPQLFGMFVTKLAVALTLVGSPTFNDKPGHTKVRGESHLLLIGDPGTGKSQFLRFACDVCNRSVLTTGTGTSSAGLTCAAIREGNEFMLEAGALVLADRGVCCIDEFSSIRPHDRATIHEAMEQQTISVAKAGLVCSLKTRTSIIAATNPKGQYDPDSDLSTNTGIATPLLSRFDIVLVLLDRAEYEWDKTISEFILRAQAGLPGGPVVNTDGILIDDVSRHFTTCWDIETFQAYLTYVKEINPRLTSEAGLVLGNYYRAQRSRDSAEAGRTTVRLLESLLRVAKAHARLMCREHVLIVDAAVSVSLVELSMGAQSDNELVANSAFVQDPDADVLDMVIGVLRDLQMDQLIRLAKDQLQPGFVVNTFESESDDESTNENNNNNNKESIIEIPVNLNLDFPSYSQHQSSKVKKMNSGFEFLSSDDELSDF